jgi:hypothetical protein
LAPAPQRHPTSKQLWFAPHSALLVHALKEPQAMLLTTQSVAPSTFVWQVQPLSGAAQANPGVQVGDPAGQVRATHDDGHAGQVTVPP